MDFALTASQHELRERVRRFAREEVAPIAREADERGEFPLQLLRSMAELGILGGTAGRAFGGSGLNNVDMAVVYEELGRADSSVRGFLTVQASLVAGCVSDWGNEDQVREVLSRLADGSWIGCYCLTE